MPLARDTADNSHKVVGVLTTRGLATQSPNIMASSRIPWRAYKTAVLFCLLALAVSRPLAEARSTRGTGTSASIQHLLVSSQDGAQALETTKFSATELGHSRSYQRGSAKVWALEDLRRALDAAPAYLTVNLPNSQEFANAFRDYKATGICDAWVDLETHRVRIFLVFFVVYLGTTLECKFYMQLGKKSTALFSGCCKTSVKGLLQLGVISGHYRPFE